MEVNYKKSRPLSHLLNLDTGHNRIVTYPAVGKAVLKSLKLHDR